MNQALQEFQIEGIKTTIPFHREVFKNQDFINGDFYTDFIDSLLLR
jgi:acetyl-CoA carboxylase biotin carboxylase subunit